MVVVMRPVVFLMLVGMDLRVAGMGMLMLVLVKMIMDVAMGVLMAMRRPILVGMLMGVSVLVPVPMGVAVLMFPFHDNSSFPQAVKKSHHSPSKKIGFEPPPVNRGQG
jgi:hypothetical protein